MNDKRTRYQALLTKIKMLLDEKAILVSNLANVAAAIKEDFSFFWVGFYLVSENELQLGPFQGTVACTKIAFGKGVCGSSWEKKEIIIVDDVKIFPGHISCNEVTMSEIVLPVIDKVGKVIAVLDIDSKEIAGFDAIDKQYLTQVVKAIESIL